jgi:hypothetical protein
MMIYHQQRFLMATKHQKEKVIQPLFKQGLDAEVFVRDFDTDRLGTFTGEIARPSSALETCIQKAKQAGIEYDHPFILASEGSFGPHPDLPFLALAHEIMVLVDLERDLVIIEQMTCNDTNYQTMILDPKLDLGPHLDKLKFPSHALCLQTEDQSQVIAKGIQTHKDLEAYLAQGFKTCPKLLLSTDMRAMMNPSRMYQIGKLGEKLLSRILSSCPSCTLPGFGVGGVDGTLHCETCKTPGNWYAREILTCVKCPYQEQRPRSDGKTQIPTEYCEYCNP